MSVTTASKSMPDAPTPATAACHGLEHCEIVFPELDSIFLYRAVDGFFVMLCNRCMTRYRDFCHVASGNATNVSPLQQRSCNKIDPLDGVMQLKIVPVCRRTSANSLSWLADAGVGFRRANPTCWKCSRRKLRRQYGCSHTEGKHWIPACA
jgi:hypothetical protein